MDSLAVQLVASIIGRAKGTSTNANVRTPLNGRTFNVPMSSTATAGTATYADNGVDFSRELGAGLSETLDLRSFVNSVQETGQALTKCRLFYVLHASDSASSAISVGNSGGSAFIPLGCLGTTPAGLPPGGFILIGVPSAAGIAVAGGNKDVAIVNSDGANAATYHIGWWGE